MSVPVRPQVWLLPVCAARFVLPCLDPGRYSVENGTGRPHISWEQNAPIGRRAKGSPCFLAFSRKRLKRYIQAGRNGMGTDNDRIHVCVRLKDEDYLWDAFLSG